MRFSSCSIALLGSVSLCCVAARASPLPGLYEVEIRINLPNVQEVAKPVLARHCWTSADLQSGRAFFVLSDNPLKRCELRDFEGTPTRATYRIECAGPNRGHAIAEFDLQDSAYRGTIRMNMGGKNMTMTESQAGKRIGDCGESAR